MRRAGRGRARRWGRGRRARRAGFAVSLACVAVSIIGATRAPDALAVGAASSRMAEPAEARAHAVEPPEAGLDQAGLHDAGPRDAGPHDAGPRDAGLRDAGLRNVGPRDVSVRDVSVQDVGLPDAGLDDALAATLDLHCLGCHEGRRAKGGLDLAPSVEARVVDEGVLRAVRARLVKRDMPPADEPERPTREEYRAAIAAIDALVAPATREVPAVRRLNRAQYAGAVRDALGVDPAFTASLLPADDIGEGFDTTADTLALPPLLVEKYFDAAEAIAMRAAPPATLARTVRREGADLARAGQGGTYSGATWLATNGTLSASFDCAHTGRFRVEATAFATQAGDEPARMAVEVDGARVAEFEVPNAPGDPRGFAHELELAAGAHTVAVRFLNDFWDPKHPDERRRDRNLGVVAIALDGPLGETPETPFERALADATGGRDGLGALRDAADRFGARLFRRALAPEESRALASLAREAAGPDAAFDIEVRALVTALLVDPRFLLRVEPARTPGARRPLDGGELATRLAFFLWSSVPDEPLLEAARTGALADPARLGAEVSRMLADPRAESLATRFAVQWLGIDRLETRSFDPTTYPALDAAMLVSMRRETELLFAEIVAGRRPVRDLLEARETFVDARLAAHYQLAAPGDNGFELRAIPATRPAGILGHGSILAATSNPTRTSPVKRGKWVLESLLDAAPPPPPPGVPQLPEGVDDRAGRPMRELMALHRANPDCASCHVRMDAIGLAFERLDADGRTRATFDGAPIDDRTELPDGRTVEGARGVGAMLATDDGFERSLARHLAVYALGRGMADADDALLDELAARAVATGRFADLVGGIVASDAFRTRVDSPNPPNRLSRAADREVE
ncbi:MAG: hypothetical protein RI967_2045 [Planctomycetota bacterium]